MDRRAFVAGGAALVLSPEPAASASRLGAGASAFPDGAMAFNRIAQGFEHPPAGLTFPRKRLLSKDGPHSCDELIGHVSLVSLWAEWCAPCLLELRDIAQVHRRWRSKGFRAVAVLTASQAKLDVHGASRILSRFRPEGLEVWVEADGGDTLFARLARKGAGEPNLPCNLLVDPSGAILARSFGAAMVTARDLRFQNGKLTEAAKADLLAHETRTLWSTPAADEFVAYLIAHGRTASPLR